MSLERELSCRQRVRDTGPSETRIPKISTKENKMNFRDPVPRTSPSERLASRERSKPSYQQVVENELRGSLSKLEHRAEILAAISQNRRISGRYELAEAYRKQSMNSKARAQSIRKLLNLA